MLQIFGEYLTQVVLIDDQHPVGELPAQGADDPFADRVRSGRLRRAGENPDAFRGEHGIEGAREQALIGDDGGAGRRAVGRPVLQHPLSLLAFPISLGLARAYPVTVPSRVTMSISLVPQYQRE